MLRCSLLFAAVLTVCYGQGFDADLAVNEPAMGRFGENIGRDFGNGGFGEAGQSIGLVDADHSLGPMDFQPDFAVHDFTGFPAEPSMNSIDSSAGNSMGFPSQNPKDFSSSSMNNMNLELEGSFPNAEISFPKSVFDDIDIFNISQPNEWIAGLDKIDEEVKRTLELAAQEREKFDKGMKEEYNEFFKFIGR
uniref:Secreted protein n=2 Tax=Bursaphelenchus xylophilus TaxID=6326 RepID=A0A1I7SIU7_BURXY